MHTHPNRSYACTHTCNTPPQATCMCTHGTRGQCMPTGTFPHKSFTHSHFRQSYTLYMLTLTYTHAHMYMFTPMSTPTHTHIHIHTHAPTPQLTRVHVFIQSHTHAHTLKTHSCTCPHKSHPTDACSSTYTNAHTQSQTYRQSCDPSIHSCQPVAPVQQ